MGRHSHNSSDPTEKLDVGTESPQGQGLAMQKEKQDSILKKASEAEYTTGFVSLNKRTCFSLRPFPAV